MKVFAGDLGVQEHFLQHVLQLRQPALHCLQITRPFGGVGAFLGQLCVPDGSGQRRADVMGQAGHVLLQPLLSSFILDMSPVLAAQDGVQYPAEGQHGTLAAVHRQFHLASVLDFLQLTVEGTQFHAAADVEKARNKGTDAGQHK